jgi:RNA polymerase sigma-70 factor, ECF subfamily
MTVSSCDGSAAGWQHSTRPRGSHLPIVNGDPQATESAVQETMLRGWQHAGEPSPEHARSRLHKVARNIAISTCPRRRRAGPGEVPLDENTVPATDDVLDRMVDAVLTASFPHSPSADHREVVVELSYRGRPAAEVATMLGIPEATARSRCFRRLHVLTVAEEQGIAGSCARARASRHLVACRGCRADSDDLVPVRAWPGRLAPAATLTSRSGGAMPVVRDWSNQ